MERIANADVLFVVDTSMATEQRNVLEQAQVPRLVEALITGDIDDDGEPDLGSYLDLHVGIVSADLGVAASQASPCGGSPQGDDAVMHRRGDVGQQGCLGEYPAFLAGYRFPYGFGTEPQELLSHLSCLEPLEGATCAPPQPLEAALKALWPAQDPSITFFGDTEGHGDALNGDFLRGTLYHTTSNELSLLAVIFITNRDDRSLREACDFVGDSSCMGSLHPVERYIDGLMRLRPGYARLVVLGAISGVPPDLLEDKYERFDTFGDGVLDGEDRERLYEALLNDPRMQEPAQPGVAMEPVCIGAEGFSAAPSPRLVQAVRGVGGNSAVLSVCSEDYRPILGELFGIKRDPDDDEDDAKEPGAEFCISPLRRQGDGRVDCVVTETLPADGPVTRCEQLSEFGREPEPMRIEDGREVCRLRQLVADKTGSPSDFGWFYDDSEDPSSACIRPTEGARIRLTEDTKLILGGTVERVCSTPVGELFGTCASDHDCAEGQFCEPLHRQCVRACTTDQDCDSGYACRGDSQPGTYCVSAC